MEMLDAILDLYDGNGFETETCEDSEGTLNVSVVKAELKF